MQDGDKLSKKNINHVSDFIIGKEEIITMFKLKKIGKCNKEYIEYKPHPEKDTLVKGGKAICDGTKYESKGGYIACPKCEDRQATYDNYKKIIQASKRIHKDSERRKELGVSGGVVITEELIRRKEREKKNPKGSRINTRS